MDEEVTAETVCVKTANGEQHTYTRVSPDLVRVCQYAVDGRDITEVSQPAIMAKCECPLPVIEALFGESV